MNRTDYHMQKHLRQIKDSARSAASRVSSSVRKVFKKDQSGKRSPVNLVILGSLAGMAVILVVSFIIITLGAYAFRWQGPAMMGILKHTPYPVAMVDGSAVKYSDFVSGVDALKKFYAKQQEADPQTVAPTDAELKETVLERLIQDEVLAEVAARFNVSVTDKEVQEQFEQLVATVGSREKAEQDLKDLYGWSIDEYLEKVLTPYLIEQKLAEALAKDESIQAESKKLAEDVLAQVKAGGDFAELAKQYSADPGSAQNGGDLGFFGAGVMVPEFEAAAFALTANETSDLVQTQFGWHIIKVLEVKKKAGVVEEVHASHILIPAVDVGTYLQEAVANAKIRRFVEVK